MLKDETKLADLPKAAPLKDWLALPPPAEPQGLIDPMGAIVANHPGAAFIEFAECMGRLPAIFMEACESNPQTTADFADAMAEAYGFGWPAMPPGSAVDEDGVYTYPDDPPLEPWGAYRHPCGAQMLVYQYGITAVRIPGDEWHIARLD